MPIRKRKMIFLEALAQGGFQVEALAKLEYDGGISVDGNPWDYPSLLEKNL